MILHGREITEPSPFSKHIKTLAEQFLQKGPIAWNKEKMDTERFLITDLLEDIEFPKRVSGKGNITCVANFMAKLKSLYGARFNDNLCFADSNITVN